MGRAKQIGAAVGLVLALVALAPGAGARSAHHKKKPQAKPLVFRVSS